MDKAPQQPQFKVGDQVWLLPEFWKNIAECPCGCILEVYFRDFARAVFERPLTIMEQVDEDYRRCPACKHQHLTKWPSRMYQLKLEPEVVLSGIAYGRFAVHEKYLQPLLKSPEAS